jgi:hypothetical protein
VEDDAGGIAKAAAYTAYAMPQIHLVNPASSLHRSVMDGKHHSVALSERHDFSSRLHSRALLGDDELAAGEIASRVRQQDGELQRKDVLAVEVLVKAVVIAGTVTQEEGRGASLASRMAAFDEIAMLIRKPDIGSHRDIPPIRHRNKARVDLGSQLFYELGQGMAKVFVFASAKAMPAHDDTTTKGHLFVVQATQRLALRRSDKAVQDSAACRIK